MRFSTVLAVSVAASASTALAYPALPSAYETVSRREVADIDELAALVARVYFNEKGQAGAKKLPAELKAQIGKQGLDGSKAAANRAKALGTSTKDIQKAYKDKVHQQIKGQGSHTPHNTQFARDLDYEEVMDLAARVYFNEKGQAGAKKLPAELKAQIGKQGLDGSKAAANRAKALGTSTKDIQKAYKDKVHQQIKGQGSHTPHNTQFARDLDYEEIMDLAARVYFDAGGRAGAKKLPAEIKAHIGKQGLDGSKAAANRAKALGTSTKDIQQAYKNKVHQQIKGQGSHTPHNTQFARDLDHEELMDLAARVYFNEKGQAGAKKLPAELKAHIGKQGLDGSKAAADRAKALGTSTKDIQQAYKNKVHQQIKGQGSHTPHNTQFARDLEYEELMDLAARVYFNEKGQAGAKKLPAELKAHIGKMGLDGSKAAANRAKALGTSTKDIQQAYKNKVHQQIKGKGSHTPHNTQFARDLEYDDLD